jgi:hypothetical protein
LAIVAGIDEAGLGPVMGPLVVSAAAFEVPDDLAETSLWQHLASCASRKAPKRGYRLHIADSKKVFNRSKGDEALEPLERGVLAMLASGGRRAESLRGLLSILAPSAGDLLAEYPWYADDVALPLRTTPQRLTFSTNALTAAMKRCSMRLAMLRCEPLPAGQFNRMVSATRNKYTASFSLVARLIAAIVDQSPPGGRLLLCVDRQGGRMRYRPALQKLWPEAKLRIVEESETCSAYEMHVDGRAVELCFRVKAEDGQLPVALASMASKYVRELFMHQLNGWWRGHLPALSPTAGYFADGRRFFEEIRERSRQMGFDDDLLLRRI